MGLQNVIPVNSDSISAVNHDPAARMLTVQFKNGGVYRYAGVSPVQHAALMRADSIGAHFHSNIRPHFKAEKVTRP